MAKYNVVLMLVAFYSTGFYPALALVNLAQILLDNLIVFEIIYNIGLNSLKTKLSFPLKTSITKNLKVLF